MSAESTPARIPHGHAPLKPTCPIPSIDSDARFREDEPRLARVRFDLLPQLSDEHPQVLHVVLVRGAPDRGEEVLLHHHLAVLVGGEIDVGLVGTVGDRVVASSSDYFVQAGSEKHLRRLCREDANDWAQQLFGLLRDPLNASIVDRDEAVMRLKRET